MPSDFTHGRFPSKKIMKAVQGGRMPMACRIVGTVFLLFWMSMPTRALIEMLSKEKLANLREAPFPGVIMIFLTAIFPIAGVAGLFSLWRGRLPVGRPAEETGNFLPPRAAQSFDSPLTGLKLKRSGGDFGQKLFFTCLWCVFTFIIATIWFSTSGDFSWTRDYWTFDKFFVLIFPLIGIGFVISCVRDAIRRTQTGRYEVEIACDRLHPGARVQVNYRFIGDATQLDHVVFSLDQRSMVMQRAENPPSSTAVVHEITDPFRAQMGTFVMTIPQSIESPCIAWRLVVKYAGLTDAFRLDVV